MARLARDRAWRRVVVVTSTFHVTRTRLIFRRTLDLDLRLVGAGHSRRRLPAHVASEWAKLAYALTLGRSP